MKEFIYKKDGSVTEVTHPDRPTEPTLLSKTALLDHAESQLGSADKVIEVLEAAKGSSAAGVRYVYERYQAATTFEKTKATSFFATLQSASIITEAEKNKLVNNWPQS